MDAYDDPRIEADLKTYDEEFKLPACTEANGCFRKINQKGAKTPLPSSSVTEAKGWAIEISTDVEATHSVCQNCHIVLVETNSAYFSDLEEGEATAAKPVADGGLVGATEISDSWGGAEDGVTVEEDSNSAFNQSGVVITAAAGDDGYLDWGAENAAEHGFPDYPASSPNVIAVGGTHLALSAASDTWESETVWNGDGATGGGCSTVFTAQPWQQETAGWSSVGCADNHRAVADVSADADPYTGIAVYDSISVEGRVGWGTVGGTSLASPIVTSIFALAGGAHKVARPAQTLYENLAASSVLFHDVVSGSNGACGKPFNEEGLSECDLAEEDASCSAAPICRATVGYDGPSGVGSPDGIAAFRPGEGAEDRKKAEEKKQAEEKTREGKEKEEEEKRNAASGGSSGGGGSGTSGSGSNGSGQSGTGTGSAGSSQASGTTSTSGAGGPSSGTGAAGTPGATTVLTPVLSGLSLTHAAAVALSHARPKALQLAFAFTLSAPARVRVTLAKQVRVHGRTHWQTLPYTFTIAAAKGHDSGRLNGRSALAPGRYRLTLTPARGLARTLTFTIA